MCEEAIALDSEYAFAHSLLGWTYFFEGRFGWTESRAESMKTAFACAQKALEIEDTLDTAHTLLSAVYFVKREYEKAIASVEYALALNPNGANEHNAIAGVLGCSGRWEESIPYGKMSIRLDPFPITVSYHWLGRAYFMTGRYDDAIQIVQKAVAGNPNYLPGHAFRLLATVRKAVRPRPTMRLNEFSD